MKDDRIPISEESQKIAYLQGRHEYQLTSPIQESEPVVGTQEKVFCGIGCRAHVQTLKHPFSQLSWYHRCLLDLKSCKDILIPVSSTICLIFFSKCISLFLSFSLSSPISLSLSPSLSLHHSLHPSLFSFFDQLTSSWMCYQKIFLNLVYNVGNNIQ